MRKLLVVAVVIVAGSGFAQTEKKKIEKLPPTTTLIFGDGTEIDGSVDHPELDIITAAPKPRFGNMIKIRTNFADKLLESVHEL